MAKDTKNSYFNKGTNTRREVLGNMHVDRANKNTNLIDKRFQDFITGTHEESISIFTIYQGMPESSF